VDTQFSDPAAGASPHGLSPDRPAKAVLADIKEQNFWAGYLKPDNVIAIVGVVIAIVLAVLAYLSYVRDQHTDFNAKRDALHAIIRQHSNNIIHKQEINQQWNNELHELRFDFKKAESQARCGEKTLPISKICLILDALKNFNATCAFEAMKLADQAQSLAVELGGGASSVDLSDVAILLSDADVPELPEQFYRRAIKKAGTAVDFLEAERGLAKASFADGRKDDSRDAINASAGVFKKFGDELQNPDDQHRALFQTYVWAVNYVGSDDMELACSYSDKAQFELDNLKQLSVLEKRLSDQLTFAKTPLKCHDKTVSSDPQAK